MIEPRTDYLMLVGGQWTDGQEEPFSLVSPVGGIADPFNPRA